MSKDKKFKKELKKIDRLLNASERVYENGNGLSVIDEKNTGKAIEYCMKAKDVIENSVARERHDKPHPLLARHVGINARGPGEIPHKNNKDMIQNVIFNRLFNFLLMLPENGYRGSKVNLMLKTLDEQTKDSLEKSGIEEEKIIQYVEGVLMDYASRMESSYKKIEKLHENKKYELGLLEKFCNNIDKFKKIKEKFDPKGKLLEEQMYDKALDYALNGFSGIIKDLKNQNPTDPRSIYHYVFSNQGIRDQEFLKQFIEKRTNNSEKYYEASNGLNLKLDEKQLGIDNTYIKGRKKVFAGFMEKKQDGLLKEARELAENGSKDYREYLNDFIGMTVNYSKLLDEDDKDIAKMFGCINPDLHVIMNEAYKDKDGLPLYEFYKNDIPELAKAVLDVKLAYIRAKRKKELSN